MKTWTTHHPCPYDNCDDEVTVTYDVGAGPEDFYQVEDTLVCELGHVVPSSIAEAWIDDDVDDYGSYLQDRMDEARESYYQRKEERY